jgi:hypothetical protein
MRGEAGELFSLPDTPVFGLLGKRLKKFGQQVGEHG